MKPKRSIYRVTPIVEHRNRTRKLVGWHVKGPSGYTSSFLHESGGTKKQAVKLAVDLAKENTPSQVIITAKDRVTHKYEIALEWSYGVDSKARG